MKKWNLESAKKDYCKTHHKKYKKEKIINKKEEIIWRTNVK